MLGLALGLSSCTTRTGACPKAIHALSAELAVAKTISDIDQTLVGRSFSACDGPDEWKQSAGVEEIGGQIGALSDMKSKLTTSHVLDFLCARYDPPNFTPPCKFR
jgi:hypothetical protein